MANTVNPLEKATANALSGKHAHVATKALFDGLDWKLSGARPPGVPHTISQLLNHMVFWQEGLGRRLAHRRRPARPRARL